jgi:uncharacterized protein YuzB (UPF0349 family)
MKIRCCEQNKGATLFVQQLKEQFVDLNIKLKKCAKQCKICKRQPFAVIDKQLVLINSFDELCVSIEKQDVRTN